MAKLYFYYSAMNAGKSTILLQASYNYQERGMETVLFSPCIDTRYQAGKICSRIGLSAASHAFTEQDDLLALVGHKKTEYSKIKSVFVDEAQFLTKNQVQQLSEVTDQLNIPVLAYGLRSDFRGEPFEGSLYLLIWADEIHEIKTICHCGAKATMNMRVDPHAQKIVAGQQIEIGGNERYVSVCRKHFKMGQAR
jgi:thymidine kinase